MTDLHRVMLAVAAVVLLLTGALLIASPWRDGSSAQEKIVKIFEGLACETCAGEGLELLSIDRRDERLVIWCAECGTAYDVFVLGDDVKYRTFVPAKQKKE